MLHDVARECEALGGTAYAVPTDVTDQEQVEALGRRALQRFGRLDIWFNNAGIAAFGRLESIPMDAWRRVIEINLFGYVHGARVAMRQFRKQGHGILIRNASIVGRTAKPDGTPYASGKFAIRGFSEALRQEVLDQPGIHICTILPSVIDTPFFQPCRELQWPERASCPTGLYGRRGGRYRRNSHRAAPGGGYCWRLRQAGRCAGEVRTDIRHLVYRTRNAQRLS
jgi:NAD(P)-dependent dehydrogenase (short-subunit alcohol dehydrogenase family)